MHRHALTLLAGVFLCLPTGAALAQTPATDRGYISLSGAYEGASDGLDGARAFPIYGETGQLDSRTTVDSGGFFDVAVGARVWRNVTVGIGFHRSNSSADAAITGSIPHPLFFNQPRSLTANVGGLERSEQAVHLNFGYMVPVNDRVDVLLFLGPSFFSVDQEAVSEVALAETSLPFTTVVAQPAVVQRSDSPVGFNVGADVSYRLLTQGPVKLGAGLFLRYSGATADIQVLDTTVSNKVGGFQVGLGGRIRF